MKKVTISQRIIFLSSILTILAGLISFVSYKGIRDVTATYQEILENSTTKQLITQNIFLSFRDARINALLSVADGASEITKSTSITNIDHAIKEVSSLIGLYEMRPMTEDEKVLFNTVKLNWAEYKDILEKIKNYHITKTENKVLLYSIVHGECPKAADKLKLSFNVLVNFHNKNIDESKNKASTQYQDTLSFTLTLASVAILFGVIVTLLISRFTKNALAQVVSKVTEVTEKLNSASSELSSSSQQLATSAQQQASSTEEISSNLEEITGMVGSTIKQADESVKLSKEISKLVDSGNESMEALERSVAEIADSNQKVEKLVSLIEEIGKKTEIIDEIVFQTRLLSFNASVEAERAGEHGRGFAVVAQEVGNLAQMSGKSAFEIGEIVKKSIKEAEEVASLNRSKVISGVESSKQTSSKLKSIQNVAKEINTAVIEVLRASEEQNVGIKQINTNVQLISQSTQENASSAESMYVGSQVLKDQGNNLEKSVCDLQNLVYGKSFKIRNSNENEQVQNLKNRSQKHSSVIVKNQKIVKSAIGQNFHNEEDDHWDKL